MHLIFNYTNISNSGIKRKIKIIGFAELDIHDEKFDLVAILQHYDEQDSHVPDLFPDKTFRLVSNSSIRYNNAGQKVDMFVDGEHNMEYFTGKTEYQHFFENIDTQPLTVVIGNYMNEKIAENYF